MWQKVNPLAPSVALRKRPFWGQMTSVVQKSRSGKLRFTWTKSRQTAHLDNARNRRSSCGRNWRYAAAWLRRELREVALPEKRLLSGALDRLDTSGPVAR
jgi:hypothetical protein